MLVFSYGTIVVLLTFYEPAKFQPRSYRHALPTGVGIFLIVHESGLGVLRLQVHLAKFDSSFKMGRHIVLAPIKLSQYRLGVSRIGLSSHILFQNSDALVELSLFKQLGALDDSGIRRPP